MEVVQIPRVPALRGTGVDVSGRMTEKETFASLNERLKRCIVREWAVKAMARKLQQDRKSISVMLQSNESYTEEVFKKVRKNLRIQVEHDEKDVSILTRENERLQADIRKYESEVIFLKEELERAREAQFSERAKARQFQLQLEIEEQVQAKRVQQVASAAYYAWERKEREMWEVSLEEHIKYLLREEFESLRKSFAGEFDVVDHPQVTTIIEIMGDSATKMVMEKFKSRIHILEMELKTCTTEKTTLEQKVVEMENQMKVERHEIEELRQRKRELVETTDKLQIKLTRVERQVPSLKEELHQYKILLDQQERSFSFFSQSLQMDSEQHGLQINVGLVEISAEGDYVMLLNEGKEAVQLKGWKIEQKSGQEVRNEFVFQEDFILMPNEEVKVWARSGYDISDDNPVAEFDSWETDVGVVTTLFNPHSQYPQITAAVMPDETDTE